MSSSNHAGGADEALVAQLDRIAEYEQSIKPTVMNRILRRLGPTRPFVAVYRRIGPKLDVALLRRTGGGINRFYGFPALTLITTGSRSGQPRRSPLFYVRDGADFVVVGTNFGTKEHPAWTGNLLKTPDATLLVGEETVSVSASLLDRADFQRLWPSFREIYPGYDKYLARLSSREPRMFALHPTILEENRER